jgi:putative aldouronate transport system permease protein
MNEIVNNKKNIATLLFNAINHVLLILLAIICVMPLVHLLAVSLSDRAAATGGFVSFWPVRFTTVSYQKVFAAGAFYSAFVISVQRTIIGTTLTMLLTVLAAYPLSKSNQEFPGRDGVMVLVLFALLFSGGLIPWFLVIRSLGLLNSIWALIIPPALPIWNIILLMNFFRMVPKEMEEAALIDGASHWAVLYYVYLPISKPALATLTLFAAVGHWNAWFDGMILTTEYTKYPFQTLVRVLYAQSDTSQRAAHIILATLPILVIYPILQRFFVSGIVLGALKG